MRDRIVENPVDVFADELTTSVKTPEWYNQDDLEKLSNGSMSFNQFLQSESKFKFRSEKEIEELKTKIKSLTIELKLSTEFIARDSGYGHSRKYAIYNGSSCVLKLNQLAYPKCCGIALLTEVSVSNDLSISQFIDAMLLIINDLDETDGYSRLLFYTTSNCKEARFFAEYPGVVITSKFKNRRSGNYLIGFEIDINFDEDMDPDEYESEDEFLERQREEDPFDITDNDLEDPDAVPTPFGLIDRGARPLVTGIPSWSNSSWMGLTPDIK